MTDIFDNLLSDFDKSLTSTGPSKAQSRSYSMQPTDSSQGQYDVTPKPEPERSTFGLVNDTVINAGNAAVGLAKSGVDLFAPDSTVSRAMGDFIKYGESQQSDKQKYMNQQLQQKLADAGENDGTDYGRFVAEAKKAGVYLSHAITTDPAKTLSEMAGNIGPFGAFGKGMQAARLSKGASTAITAGLSAGLGMGEVRGNIWDKISSVTDEDLKKNSPEYAELRKTMSEADAKREIGANISRNFPELAAVGALSALTGKYGVEGMAAGVAPKMGRTAAAIVGGVDEGVLQGGAEQVASNKGVQRAIPSQSLMEDVGQNMIAEGIPGVGMGALTGGGNAHVQLPPPLKPVADAAAQPHGILSRAAMAGNAGNLATGVMPVGAANVAPGSAPADAPDQTQLGADQTQSALPPTDEMGQQVRNIEAEFRGSGLLDTLRLDGVNVPQIFDDLNTARNTKAPLEQRQEALSAVTELLQWAKANKQPNGQMDNVATPQAPGVAPIREEQQVPSVDAAIAALRDDQFSRLLSDNDRQNLVQAIQASQTANLPAATRANAARAANEIVGRYQAPQGQATGQGQALTDASKTAPQQQQNVGNAQSGLQESDFAQDVDAPKVTIPAGKDPAFIRKRAAEIKQLVAMGFESVERNGSEFYLINSKTGQRFKLTGMADSQLARKAIADRVNEIAHTAAASPKNDRAEPTKAQIEAGNYKKSDVIELNGMQIKIENPKDSMRRGTSPDGEMWETKMAHHYGEFQGTLGADGDKLDVFVGPRPDSQKVYVIDQNNSDGSFDEHKVMMGFTSEEAARAGYLANYEKGWTGLGAITEMGVDEFKTWAKSRAAKKPAAAIAEKPAAKVAEKEAAPIEKAVESEQKQEAPKDAEPAKFSTYGEAKAYISAQRRSGTSIAALPYPNEDGSFGIAIKGTPGYAKAEKFAADQNKKAKKAKKPTAKQGEIFTVKDNGQDVELQKVSKDELPADSSSVVRDGERRQLTQSDVSLLERLAQALGKQIQIFSGPVGDGFVRPEDRDTIFINEVTSVNPVAVFGHELFHKIKDENPKAWAAIAKVVEANIGKEAFDRMMGYGYEQGEVLEEIVSDLGGDFLSDGAFWRDVFSQIEADHGKDAKGIIAKLVAYLNNLVEQLINDIKQPGFNASSLVKDIRAVRAAYKEGITQYLKDSDLTRPALQAQILREEQGVKKSVARSEDPQAQYDAVVAKYKDTAEWLKAPNGVDSNLNERQWVQVRTPAFKKWFGDWEKFAKLPGGVWNDDKGAVSKVVDANGEPMVVFHGSSKGGFSEFKTPTGAKRGDLGIFTTPNLEMAKSYVSRRGGEIQYADMGSEAIEGGDTPGYYANFVNIRNPIESDFEGAHWNGERPEQWIVEVGGDQERDYDGKGYFTEEEAMKFGAEFLSPEQQEEGLDGREYARPADEHYETTDSVVREARSDGNDGAIIRNVVDSGSGVYTNYIDEPSDVFVALNPDQLKSATFNTGEFSTKSADMRFSRPRDIERAKAQAYEQENGILPYVSSGAQVIPVNIQKSVKREGKYGNHPVLGIPVNANGSVTLYYPTTNADARRIVRERSLKGTGERVYLTNESSVGNVMAKRGNIEQKIDGANVLLQINPDLLQIDTEHEDGRKDFFIAITEGESFRQKMSQVKLFTQNAPRDKGLSEKTTINDITSGIADAIEEMAGLNFAGRRARVKEARLALKAKHNVGTLLSVNGKLEKTNVGGYGLDYDGKDVMSMGLGLASAQKINDEQKLTTCPQSAICQSLCLGETSGQNLLYGGEGQFKSGPRMSQYLKTEAMVQSPEDFATVLFAEIDRFARNAKRDDYQATVRLNVTSDFPPKVFEALIKAFPDVMFYDYTKLNNKVIADNHHLTYSSTGASQIVDGKTIINPESNWDAMVTKLNRGSNVAMAFTDKNEMPAFVIDGKTGQKFQVWNGDNYDARFLDPKREDGIGMIVGLTNKDRTTKPEEAAVKHKGFFVDYNPERDGDTVVIQDQEALASGKKVIPIKAMKFSRERDAQTKLPEFKDWFSDSKVVDAEGNPLVVYHGTNQSFNSFDNSRNGQNTKAVSSIAFFFSEDSREANEYAMMAGRTQVADATNVEKKVAELQKKIAQAEKRGDWDAAEKLYLEMEEADLGPINADDSGQSILPVYLKIENPKIIDANESFDGAQVSEAIKSAKAEGYDGLKLMNVYDPVGDRPEQFTTTQWVAFKANQIKSATGNDGGFDPTDPDIRKSRKRDEKSVDRFPDTPEFKKWFKGSKVVNAKGEPLVVYHGTSSDFAEFSKKGVRPNFTSAQKQLGFFFSDSADYASAYAGKGFDKEDASVMPVYLSLQNPKMESIDKINEIEESWKQGEAKAYVKDLKEQGYDGIIFEGDTRKFGFVREFVAFEPNQIKSATGNNGEYSDSPNITKSLPRPQFYSQLQRAIEGAPERLATMSAPAWKQWIEANAPKLGVKKDEVDWSGIKDYLDLQGKAKLTKADISAYLADSGVKISETVLRKPLPSELPDGWYAEENADGQWAVYDDLGDERGSGDTEIEAIESSGTFQNDSARSGTETRYGQYTLPGGENYREVLITLPTKNPVAGISPAQAARVLYSREYANLTPEQQADVKRRIADEDSSPAYMSSHWDEANILAHIRVNDRTDADGNRVLFVEEVQSDWGQEGLKSGFAESIGDMPNMSADELLRKHGHSMTESQREYLQDFSERWDNADSDEEIDALTDEYQKWIPEQRMKGVAKAPFVTKTEGWLDLALKRIAMMAVDGGYDKVAFVNGQQSADRYDMAKQVEAVRVNLNPDGTYQLGVQPIGKRMQRHDTSVPANKLADMIGKELAEKAIAEVTDAGVDGGKVYSGLDLKVGGEGMTKFYDEILPQRLSKVMPKLGGEKASTVDAGNATEIKRVALTAKIRNLPFESKERAALTKELHALEQGYSPLEQLGFDVTDKMREAVSGGVPLFSRARKPWFEDINSIKLASGYQVGDFITSSKKVTWWDKSVGTMYNLAQKHPEFKRVFDAVQRFIDDVSVYANKAADLAPNILPRLESWKDIAKTPMSAEDVAALRDPVFQGTLSFSRDENGDLQPEDDVEKAGVVFSDKELRDYFQLNDRQIALYREFRAAVNQSITTLNASDMLRYLGEDGDAIRDQVMAAKTVKQSERIISAHLDLLIEQQPKRAEVLTNTKEVISEKVGQAISLMARGYAPLSRYGEFTVYVVSKDGEQQYFSMFESQAEANKMAHEMREQYPDSEVTTGTMSKESYKLFSGVTPESLALFGEAMGLEESGVDEKSQAYQQYLKLAKSNRSAMKRLIQRKGIDGFSEDAGRVLAGFVYSNARQVSTNLHAGEIGKSAAAVKSGDLKDMAIKLMNYIQNPQEEAQAVRGLMFAQYIGGSIASALVNMTQPFTMTMPYLSQFAGVTGAAARMTDAVNLVSRGIKDDEELAAALKRAEADGVVSPQEVHQLMSQSQGKGALKSGDGTTLGDNLAKANNAMAKISLGWGKMFGAAEQFNRRVTFIAAYKVAREQGMANPFEFAEKAIRETQGVYNKGNKPAWARGAVGATLFTFKQYSIAYVEFLQRMWGNGPEGKKAVGMALLVLFAVSGLGGLPGADDLDDVIDGIAQRVFNKSFDSKQAKKEFLSGFVGDGFADFLMGGITSIPGSPIDLSGRMGLGNLIPGTGFFTKKSSYTRDLAEIGGPAFSMASNWLVAAGQVLQGDATKAVKTVSPQAIQNLVKASDMWTMGMYRDEKGRKVIDVDAWEGFVKLIGFQPASVKKVQEATSTQQNLIGQNKIRETEIADLWTAGRVERDQDKIARAKEELAQWNKDNPQSKIEIDPKQINKRVQQANMSKAQRIAATAPKEIRNSVKKELEKID